METDPEGAVVADSPSWRAYTGQTLEEWLGHGWLDAIHPDDRAYAERQWRRAIAARGLVDAEFRLRAPDGGWRWINVRAAPVLDREGRIEKWAGINIDIDARRRAEEDLRESEERQAFLLRLSDELRSLSDATAVQSAAMRLLAENFGASRAMFFHVDPDGDGMTLGASYQADAIQFPSRVRLSDFGEDLSAGFAAGRTVAVDDTEAAGASDAERTWAATERARAGTELRESEQRFSALFAASPAPFLILKPDAPRFTVADVNDAYLAATMRTREDVVGRGVFEAFPGNPGETTTAGVSTMRASLEQVLVSRQPDALPDLRYDVARPDGSFEQRWWSPVNSPLLDADGEVAAIIHNAYDVSEQYRARTELRHRGEQLDTLVQQAPIGIYLVDADFRIAQVNGVARAVFGNVPDLIGRDFGEVMHILWETSYADELAALWRHTLETGESHVEPERAEVRADCGAVEYYSWRIDRITLPDGRYGVVAYFHDISEQVRARLAIAASEERYQALFAGSPVPFMVLTPNAPDFTITAANEAYFAATRTTPDTLIGRRLFDVFPDDPERPGQLGSEALALSLDRVLATRRTDVMERVRYDLVTPDGFEPHWWEAINAPMLDAAGEITAIIHQVHRVTELQRAEEAERERLERQTFLLRLSDTLRRNRAWTRWRSGRSGCCPTRCGSIAAI